MWWCSSGGGVRPVVVCINKIILSYCSTIPTVVNTLGVGKGIYALAIRMHSAGSGMKVHEDWELKVSERQRGGTYLRRNSGWS